MKTIVVGKNSTLRKPGFVSIARSNSLRAAIDAHNTKLVQSNAEQPSVILEEKEYVSQQSRYNPSQPQNNSYNNNNNNTNTNSSIFQTPSSSVFPNSTNINNQSATTQVQSPMYNNIRNQQPYSDPNRPVQIMQKDPTISSQAFNRANGVVIDSRTSSSANRKQGEMLAASSSANRKQPEVPFSPSNVNTSHHSHVAGSNPGVFPSAFNNFDLVKKSGVNTSNETDSGVYSLNEEMNNLHVQNYNKVSNII